MVLNSIFPKPVESCGDDPISFTLDVSGKYETGFEHGFLESFFLLFSSAKAASFVSLVMDSRSFLISRLSHKKLLIFKQYHGC